MDGDHDHQDGDNYAQSAIRVHGALMLFAWGVVIPFGAIIAIYGRDNTAWFRYHLAMQATGVFLTMLGAGIAVDFVNDSPNGHFHSLHMTIGLSLCILVVLQVSGALLRPHSPENGEAKTINRLKWENMHKCLGRVLPLMGFLALFTGVLNYHLGIDPLQTERETFLPLVLICLGCCTAGTIYARYKTIVSRDKVSPVVP